MIARNRRCRAMVGDRGSAPVEFVLVAPLVLLVFCAIVQIGLAGYVRTTLVAAAAEGARAGAAADSNTAIAIRRTRAAVATSIAEGVVEDVTASERTDGGVPVIAVTVHARLPLFGLLGPASLKVTGRALRETPQ